MKINGQRLVTYIRIKLTEGQKVRHLHLIEILQTYFVSRDVKHLLSAVQQGQREAEPHFHHSDSSSEVSLRGTRNTNSYCTRYATICASLDPGINQNLPKSLTPLAQTPKERKKGLSMTTLLTPS